MNELVAYQLHQAVLHVHSHPTYALRRYTDYLTRAYRRSLLAFATTNQASANPSERSVSGNTNAPAKRLPSLSVIPPSHADFIIHGYDQTMPRRNLICRQPWALRRDSFVLRFPISQHLDMNALFRVRLLSIFATTDQMHSTSHAPVSSNKN